ncbi:MAG: hypothetical protein ABIC40_06425, partial [bacterium]
MSRRLFLTIIAVCTAIMVFSFGCTRGENPASPSITDNGRMISQAGSSILWGFYEVSIDTETQAVEIVPARTPAFTANVTRFMQPPVAKINLIGVKLIFPDTTFDTGYVVCDVTLKHPFPSALMYRGFDVMGICMGDGSMALDHDGTASYPSPGDLTVLNADGYTRWWNSSEFGPMKSLFGYTPGTLASKNFTPNSVLNGYKYFTDELDAEDDFILDPVNRGTFSPSSQNTRRYKIQFPVPGGTPQIKFGYAVSANWAQPDLSGAPSYPVESFFPEANSAEAYKITVTDAGSTAWFASESDKGGTLN